MTNNRPNTTQSTAKTVPTSAKKKPLTQAELKKKQALEQTKKFKKKYFDYYDDVKSHTNKVYDW